MMNLKQVPKRFKRLSWCLSLCGLSFASQAEDLMAIYQQSLATNPEILQAQADRDTVLARVGISLSSLLPQLSASLGYNWSQTDYELNTVSPEANNTTGTVTLTQSIFNFSYWKNLDIASQKGSQAEVAYQSEIQQLMLDVASKYFGVLEKQDNLNAQKANQKATGQTLRQMQQKFKVGLVAVANVHQAQAGFDGAVAATIGAENELSQAFEELNVLTGGMHTQLDPLDVKRFSPTGVTPNSSNEWIKLAEQSSLSLSAARMGKNIAFEEVTEKQSGHFPTLSLNGDYTHTMHSDASTLGSSTGDSDRYNVGVTFRIPIFDGLKTTRSTDVQRFNYLKQTEALELAHRNMKKEVRNQFNSVKSSLSLIKARSQAVVSAQSSLRATRAGFDVGTNTIIEVLDQTKKLYDAKVDLTKARFTYVKTLLALKLAAGTITVEDLEMINRGLLHPTPKTAPAQPAPSAPTAGGSTTEAKPTSTPTP